MSRFTDDLALSHPTTQDVERALDQARRLRAKAMRKSVLDVWEAMAAAVRPAPRRRDI